MPRYRKRPVVIEAHQWDGTPEGATPIIDWILATGTRSARYVDYDQQGDTVRPAMLHIDTLEGTMTASRGDWIIRGVAGEHYPCADGIFRETYEVVDDSELADTSGAEETLTRVADALRDYHHRLPTVHDRARLIAVLHEHGLDLDDITARQEPPQ